MRMSLIAVAGALALSACATEGAAPQDTAARDCFFSDTVSGYNVIDDRTVEIRAGNDRYRLTTLFNARNLDWTQSVAIRSTTGSICTGNGNGVEIIGGEPQRTYPVQSITRAPEAVQGS